MALPEPLDGDGGGYTIGGGTGASGTPPPTNTETPPAAPYVPPGAPPISGCASNPAAAALSGTVQRFEDLPDSATTGALYEVAGNADSNFTSYYVRRNGTVWDEAVAPGLKNAIDPFTMPHALIRLADGTFVFQPFCWKPRQVGDTVTNPAPAFIGRSIRDVFFYQNRLGFLADESVVFSAAGDYGEFWRKTVLDYIDSDTISVAASTTDVALLDHAVPFNDGIMLFSAQRQFSLSNGEAGAAATSIEMQPVTNYALAPGVRPVPLGDAVYFASDQGSYTALQEYQRLDGKDATDAAEVTAHVPNLLPSGVSQLIAAPDLRAVIVIAKNSTAPGTVFAYQFYWDGDRKILSAWRRWTFGDGQVLSGSFQSGKLTVIVRRADKAYLETIDLREDALTADQDHMIYLDRQVSLLGTYDSGTGRTAFTFPYAPDPAKLRMLRTAGSDTPESIIEGETITVAGTAVTVEGDESGHPVTAGEAYRTAVRFSRQYPLDYQNRPLTTGRLQLRSWTVSYADTPYFTAEVMPYGSRVVLDDASKFQVYDITSQRVGDADFVLGELSYGTGSSTFSVEADAAVVSITLANDTPFASNFVSAEWEGLFFSRAR